MDKEILTGVHKQRVPIQLHRPLKKYSSRDVTPLINVHCAGNLVQREPGAVPRGPTGAVQKQNSTGSKYKIYLFLLQPLTSVPRRWSGTTDLKW